MVERMETSYPFPEKQQRWAESSWKQPKAENGRQSHTAGKKTDLHPYIINSKYGHILGFTHFQETGRANYDQSCVQ